MVGGWLSLGAVLHKRNKIGVLKDSPVSACPQRRIKRASRERCGSPSRPRPLTGEKTPPLTGVAVQSVPPPPQNSGGAGVHDAGEALRQAVAPGLGRTPERAAARDVLEERRHSPFQVLDASAIEGFRGLAGESSSIYSCIQIYKALTPPAPPSVSRRDGRTLASILCGILRGATLPRSRAVRSPIRARRCRCGCGGLGAPPSR